MKVSLEEALRILKLDYNCTEEEVKKAYRSLMKRVHPDVSEANTEEFAKKVNACRDYLLERIQRKKEREKEEKERENRIKREVFKKGISDFKEEIVKYQENYKDNRKIRGLCEEYFEKLYNLKSQEELDKLRLEFQHKVEEMVQKIKLQIEKKYMEKRKRMKNYFLYKNYEFSMSNGSESVRAAELFRKLLELIYITPGEELDALIPLVNEIKFKDLDHDFEIVDKLMRNYQIYIDICNGKMYFAKLNGDYFEMKQIEGQDQFTIKISQLAGKFVSLNAFFNNAYFVGDRNVYQVENGKYNIDSFGTGEYLYYFNDLILKREVVYYLDEKCINRFYFVSTLKRDYYYQFRNYKTNLENEKYRDKKICIDAIYNYADIIKSRDEKNKTF